MKTFPGPWYVSRRAELLAELFVQYLAPDEIIRGEPSALRWDYSLRFDVSQETVAEVFVEVKATEREVGDSFTLAQSAGSLPAVERDKNRLIFALADVKRGDLYFAWANALTLRQSAAGPLHCSGHFTPVTDEEAKKLRASILANKATHRTRSSLRASRR